MQITTWHPLNVHILDHFKKGHSDKGHKIEKKGDEEEKHTKFFDEDGDEAHDEKKGIKHHSITIEWLDFPTFDATKNMNTFIGSFEEHHGSKKGGHHKKGHKKGYV